MYPLTPIKIYALDSVLSDPLCTARMDRILKAIGRTRGEITRVDEANVPEIAAEIAGLWPPKEVPAGMTRSYMRPLVFTRIRKWDKDVPVYISTESREMWDDLKGELGQNPRAYICGCSPVAVPGRKLALSEGLSHSTYLREGS